MSGMGMGRGSGNERKGGRAKKRLLSKIDCMDREGFSSILAFDLGDRF